MRQWGTGAALLLAACCVIGLSHGKLSPLPRTAADESYLPDPAMAKLTSFGFDALLADFYWLQAVQLLGGPEGARGKSHRIGALVDLVTRLNPRVDHPYRFAALWMTDDLAAVHKANVLIQRGIEAHPDDWRNHFHLAFNYFFFLGENQRAAEVLATAVVLPRAPVYLGRLAARLRSDRGGLSAASAFLATLLQGAEDPQAREAYEQALQQVETERLARVLDRARQTFRERHARDIVSIDELVTVSPSVLERLPPDPFGSGWDLNKEGVIVSSGIGYRYVPQIDATNRQRIRQTTEGRTSGG
ncbi:MAG: hypothetical protein GY723_09920 [bacterium]|nr:hypothetical protein [bacterium]